MATKTSVKYKLRQKEDRNSREAILGAALKLFTQKGYDGTSINEISIAAGFSSKASIYNHFKSKEEVSDALTRRILSQIEQIILTAYECSYIDVCSDKIYIIHYSFENRYHSPAACLL